jgi:hypothetical protein
MDRIVSASGMEESGCSTRETKEHVSDTVLPLTPREITINQGGLKQS